MAIILNEQGKILIGYSPRDKSYKFPQGGLEQSEDILDCIKRELVEELDYHLREEQILETFSEKINYPFPPDCHPEFMGQELSIVKIKHDYNIDSLVWILPHEIINYNTEYRADAYWRALQIAQLI